ncbi:MAG TPA: hypothetical protein ENN60_01145 [archaeon]|nr:hypothetical protein [archaeon]
MQIVGLSRSFAQRAESDLELFSKLVGLQGAEEPVMLTRDIYLAKNGKGTFVMTQQHGGFVVLDLVETKENMKAELVKRGTFGTLVEVQRGKVLPLDKSLAGSIFELNHLRQF